MSILKNLIFLLVLIFVYVFYVNNVNYKNEIDKNNTLLFPPRVLPKFAFGYNQMISDILWLRFLQDVDACKVSLSDDHYYKLAQKNKKKKEKSVEKGKDTKDSKYKNETEVNVLNETLSVEKRQGRCKEGWGFKVLDSITELSPKFVTPFLTGGSILSVVTDDIEGAKRIYDKGLRYHPNNWQLAFRGGYHFLVEVKDAKRAAEFFAAAARNGAPKWVIILSSRLYTKSGRYEIAKKTLEDFIKDDPDSNFAQRARERLELIKKEYNESKN